MNKELEYDLKLLGIMATGIFIALLVEITDIKDYPEIWSVGYVTVLNIISKVVGFGICLTAIILFVFYEPKSDK